MSQLLRSARSLQLMLIEQQSGVDAQGKPQYSEGATVSGRVVVKDDVTRGGMTTGAVGEEVATMATIWIDALEEIVPCHGDRITTEDGLVGIVVEKKESRTIASDALDHVRVKLRKE